VPARPTRSGVAAFYPLVFLGGLFLPIPTMPVTLQHISHASPLGAAVTERARRGVPARVLVLTTYDTDSHVLPAIEAGATGYLLKDAPRDELLRAVRAAARGEAVLSPSVAARLMNRLRTPATGPLSRRELEMLRLWRPGTPTGRRRPGSLRRRR
jgi:DNA-binding NarL/FixJ family response regulator